MWKKEIQSEKNRSEKIEFEKNQSKINQSKKIRSEKKPKQKNRNKKITLRIECKRDERLQIMSENVQIGVFIHLELINWLIHVDKRCNHRNW